MHLRFPSQRSILRPYKEVVIFKMSVKHEPGYRHKDAVHFPHIEHAMHSCALDYYEHLCAKFYWLFFVLKVLA